MCSEGACVFWSGDEDVTAWAGSARHGHRPPRGTDLLTCLLHLRSQSQKQNVDINRQAKFAATPSLALFVNLKNVVCKIGEDAEVLMSLYDPVESKFISENYLVRWSSCGLPKDIDRLHHLRAVFTIVRVGRMELRDNNARKLTSGLRRPFGVAGNPSLLSSARARALRTSCCGTSAATGFH
ncbi:Dedicator of cytokinesis protein 1 [Galemys pyrenaicus]|uniref:Dedicator of cytokinesis protein 1 n=1 Tax=Galemys pyrenaicus TaxID=202257 RepID=A0A8J6AVV3_GALPY|nr:Dedicator of cytokinesis protein 1 [Galemys pyrenaicus]